MRKSIVSIIVLLLLCGCSNTNSEFERAMSLRARLLNADGCRFSAEVTADFRDKTYTFTMQCSADRQGKLDFVVLEPDYISGISGAMESDGGKLIFDDMALAFELQADGLLSPVSGPWVFVQALRGGYVRYCGKEDQLLCMTVDDSYEEDALMLNIWLDNENLPVHADIYENNRRILSVVIKEFQFL